MSCLHNDYRTDFSFHLTVCIIYLRARAVFKGSGTDFKSPAESAHLVNWQVVPYTIDYFNILFAIATNCKDY